MCFLMFLVYFLPVLFIDVFFIRSKLGGAIHFVPNIYKVVIFIRRFHFYGYENFVKIEFTKISCASIHNLIVSADYFLYTFYLIKGIDFVI